MILSFNTQLNGKPTYFVEKIHKGIRENYMLAPVDPSVHYPTDYSFIAKDKKHSKIHTIREDKTDRWKPGTKIDFFINCRQPNMFRFAPVIPVVSTQTIEFIPIDDENYCIYIDGKALTENQINQLAINDGFDSTLDFLNYFQFGFVGKIIHWTSLKY